MADFKSVTMLKTVIKGNQRGKRPFCCMCFPLLQNLSLLALFESSDYRWYIGGLSFAFNRLTNSATSHKNLTSQKIQAGIPAVSHTPTGCTHSFDCF